MQTRRIHPYPTLPPRRATPAMLVALACAGTLTGCGGGADTRTDGPGVNVGLEAMVGTSPSGAGEADAETDLEALIALQAAQLAEAYGTPVEELAEPDTDWTTTTADGAETDTSLSNLLGGGEETTGEVPSAVASEVQDQALDGAAAAAEDGEAGSEPEAVGPTTVEALYAQLDEALGQEVETTSEPFRTAVAVIAMAAAQGRDPLEAVGPTTRVGAALSPEERERAAVVAEMLAMVFSADADGTSGHASALAGLSERLSRTVGMQIARALLCTEVRGFGRYSEFPKTDFLAGRRVRALLYVEVEGFEHREMDETGLGGLPVEERWAIDLTQTLELYHSGEGKILAWKRPEEIVVETSRNKQRDFYLLTDLELPETLTVGSYQLKVVIKDRVAGARAEVLIPIGIVADPALAWTDR